jgi:hypothetical protein
MTKRNSFKSALKILSNTNRYTLNGLQYFQKKLIITGDVIIQKNYPFKLSKGYISNRKTYKKTSNQKSSISINRSKTNLVHTINCNKTKYTKLITLTLKDNIVERTIILKYFKLFLLRYKRKYFKNLSYVSVIEPQERGSLHIHLIAFLDSFIPYQELNSLWTWGFTDIKVLKDNDIARYMAKYFTKDSQFINQDKNFNKKILFKSRGLKKPIIKYDYEVSKTNQLKLKYKYSYEFKNNSNKCFIYQEHDIFKTIFVYEFKSLPDSKLVDLIQPVGLPF